MSVKEEGLKLSPQEVAKTFASSDWAATYPPILTLNQVATLLQIPKQTLYDWRSRGLLKSCSRKMGKHVRFFRDRLVQFIFNEGVSNHTKK